MCNCVVVRTRESIQVANILRKYVCKYIGLCLIARKLSSAQLAVKERDRNRERALRLPDSIIVRDYRDSTFMSIRSFFLSATLLIKSIGSGRSRVCGRTFAYIYIRETK